MVTVAMSRTNSDSILGIGNGLISEKCVGSDIRLKRCSPVTTL